MPTISTLGAASARAFGFGVAAKKSVTGYQGIVTADGANHLWMLNETSGTTLKDSIGSFNLALSGGYALNAPTGGVGIPNGVSFNGTTGSAAATVTWPSGAQSLELWWITPSSGNVFAFYEGSQDLALQWYSGRAYGYAPSPYAAKAISSGFHQVVIVADGANHLLYIDGALAATTASTATPAGGSSKNISIGSGGGSYYFPGVIAGVATFPFALTATQVLNHYNAGK